MAMKTSKVLFGLFWIVCGWFAFSRGQIVPDEDLDTKYRMQLLRVEASTEVLLNISSKLSDRTQVQPFGRIGESAILVAIQPAILDEVKELFRKHQIQFEVHFEDVREMIEEQYRENQQLAEGEKVGEFNFARYHPYDEIVQFLEDTVERYPKMASLINVANTYEGRKVIGIKIGVPKSTPKHAVWIDAGIHAREWIAPATALYLIGQLVSRYGHDQTVTDLVERLDWYIAPVINPDGYMRTWSSPARRLWRKSTSFYNTTCEGKNDGLARNCSCSGDDMNQNCPCEETSLAQNCTCLGVDFNRNWDIDWDGPGSSTDPCSDVYRGPYPMSEPEVKGVTTFIWQRRERMKAYLSLHSNSQLWVGPYGYNATKIPPDYEDQVKLSEIATAAIKRVHGKEYRHGRAGDILYIVSGSSKDWAYEKAGIVQSYTVELRDTGEYGFLLPQDQIIPTGEEMFPAFIHWTDITSGTSDDWAYEKAGIVHSYCIELRDTGEYGFLLPQDQIIPTGEEMFPAFIQVGLYVWDGPNYEYDPNATSGMGRAGCLLDIYLWLLSVALMCAVAQAEMY